MNILSSANEHMSWGGGWTCRWAKKGFFKFHGVICYSLLLTLAEIESFAPSLLSLSDFGSQSNKNFDN